MHREASADIERAAQRLLEHQRQVSTGLRVTKPSDDPSATATAIVEKSEIAASTQYAKVGDSVQARLTVMDTILSDMITKLTAAQTTVLSAQGSTATQAHRDVAAQELAALRDAVIEDMNTSFHGIFVFGGASGIVPPYTKNGLGVVGPYAGSTREVSVEIDRGRSVTVVFNGATLAQGTDVQDVFAEFNDAIAAAQAGDNAALDVAMEGFERAFTRMTHAQSRVGVELRTIDEQHLRLDQSKRAGQARVSKLEDANLAEAITNMNQAEAAYRAALGAADAITNLSLMDYIR